MFHRVGIIEQDQAAQRFIWCNRETGTIEEYKMNVITFGATCSPYQAQFVKNYNADLFLDKYPAAVKSIQTSYYVDDWIVSFDSVGEAQQRMEEVVEINKHAGFEIKGWYSNSVEITDSILPKLIDAENKTRILGMKWDCETDTIQFQINSEKLKMQKECYAPLCQSTTR